MAGAIPLLVPGEWALAVRLLLAAVAAGLGGAAGSYFGVSIAALAEARTAREALDRVLEALDSRGEGGQSVFSVLLADSCPTPFWGRRNQRDQLWAWCDRPGEQLLVLAGGAGLGKTRLALHIAEGASEEWTVGRLRPGRAGDLVAAASAAGRNVLALVDDADSRTDLGHLMDDLATHSGKPLLKVLLIARHGDGLRTVLAEQTAEHHRYLLADTPVITLGPLGETSDLIRWYGQAVPLFAARLRIPAPAVSDTTAPVRAGQTMLEIFAEAVSTVLRAAPPGQQPHPLDDVASILFDHETTWWNQTARLPRWGVAAPTDALLARTITALTLLGPENEDASVGVLRRVPDLADAAEERLRNLWRWARYLYPAGTQIRIGPDLLADWFTTRQLITDSGLARCLLTDLDEDQISRVLTVLARAGEHHPAALSLFSDLAAGQPLRLARYAIHATLVSTTQQVRLDITTAAILLAAELGAATLDQLEQLIPAHALPHCAHAIAHHRLQLARHTNEAPQLATRLTGLAVTLRALGRTREALDFDQEAVALRRDLAATNPAHQPDLAYSLASLAITLGALGRTRETLDFDQEAVALRRDLAATNPAHQPDLAHSLANLAATLRALGRTREALDFDQEAVALFRDLTATSPAYRPDLAVGLNKLAITLSELGQPRKALDLYQEAVALRRNLAATNPAYQPDLAHSLANLAATLRALGRAREALDFDQEAVALLRDLAATSPAHQPELAISLANLAATLRVLGRAREALDFDQEAVALRRDLAATNPAHQGDLAYGLNNLANTLRVLGRSDEAFNFDQEAVALLRDLAATNPAHQADLATGLTNLAATLRALGRLGEALDFDQESVALFRDLAATNPAHQPTLAHSLNNLANTLQALGQSTESVTPLRESCSVLRGLAREDRALYGPAYRSSRAALQRLLVDLGRPEEAISFDLPADPENDR
ncbi:tetratricopeptide repeat protein [Nonomuraea soli]|uniref:Tetratricopeptide (TPR) repeat protein n=1 Tax=Nonomuraea soli TaxID=1032476 RepID=A0A7W0CJN1_9ACTN|nr:tetratricopeptide repeat protein [Nonomuraea soli]MBA2892381.1 tetratricopeptide (TPR) repeat protein [Nonomuraea soli]